MYAHVLCTTIFGSILDEPGCMQAFRLWSKSVRGAKLARCKASLSSSLFILNPVFQSALLKFSDLCCNVEGQLLLQPVPPEPVSLQGFLESQEDHVERCKEELAGMADEALECVTDVCKQSLAQLEKELAEVCALQCRSIYEKSRYVREQTHSFPISMLGREYRPSRQLYSEHAEPCTVDILCEVQT